jgi:hypothetical protein
MWASGHTDLSQLMQNTIRWVSGGETPVSDYEVAALFSA